MKRSAFLKRMAFAALATVFMDLPLPRETEQWTPERTGRGTVFYDGERNEFWLYFAETESSPWMRIL